MKLKRFQSKTVREVLARLKKGAYALADETGLGKTVVCADVARALIEDGSNKNPFVIFYVAPSIELLDQNLDSIVGHLEAELKCADAYNVKPVISRVTQLPLVLAEQDPQKKNVFVIGLSPDTSFKISGKGKKEERAYLAALFGIWRSEEAKSRINRFFWCLKRPMDKDFEDRIANRYTSQEKLGALYRWRTDCREEFSGFLNDINAIDVTDSSTLKARRRVVTQIRRSLASHLVKTPELQPDLVVFDEWHKYKSTCFEPRQKSGSHERLVADLLATLRKAKRSKVLFVSATPFTVDYRELEGSGENVTSNDLKRLIQLFWDKDRFETEYQCLKDKQVAFVAAVERLLRHDAADDLQMLKTEASRCCKAYEAELRRYCVRTERPKVKPDGSESEEAPQWSLVFNSGSAKEFLRRFSAPRDLRSPVTAMWMDGHTFPEAGYDGLKGHEIRNLPKEHWKIQRLRARLRDSFAFGDRLHSLDRPPLWLWPEAPLRGRKHLIFSEFHFVPEEICSVMKVLHSHVKGTSRFSGSVLGFFPLVFRKKERTTGEGSLESNRKGRTTGEKSLDRSIHFPLFYPFLFWELDSDEVAKRIAGHRRELRALIGRARFAVPTILEIDALLVQGIEKFKQAINARQVLMEENCGIPASPRFREYVLGIVEGRMDAWSPGRAAALVVRDQRGRRGKDPRRPNGSEEKALYFFEENALRLGESLLHLLVAPEAQVLKKHARIPARCLPPRWNKFLRFALWYTNRYRLRETLKDFADVLAHAGHNGTQVLTEMISSMSLKRGSVGTKFIRSFHDRKTDETMEVPGKAGISKHSLRTAFNSPFPPYVLASTSVGQEGLDFHRYCDSIIHWTPPGIPAILRQREGRLDRFGSLQVRIAVQQIGKAARGVVPDEDGLSPDFVVMQNGERLNRPRSEVFYLPFTAQHAAWERCLERMHYDDLLIGAPDPLADERTWMSALDEHSPEERERRFSLLSEFSISLRPKG